MKKSIITMLLTMVMAFAASAAGYSYLHFTVNGSDKCYSTAGLKVVYNGTTATVTNNTTSATLTLSQISNMYFSNSNSGGTTVQIGDVNGDGSTSMSDVTTLISYVLGNNPSPIVVEACDVNGDGSVTMSDVTMLISNVLGS